MPAYLQKILLIDPTNYTNLQVGGGYINANFAAIFAAIDIDDANNDVSLIAALNVAGGGTFGGLITTRTINGGTLIQDPSKYSVIAKEFGTSGTMIGYGLTMSGTTAGAYVNSATDSIYRSAIVQGNGRVQIVGTDNSARTDGVATTGLFELFGLNVATKAATFGGSVSAKIGHIQNNTGAVSLLVEDTASNVSTSWMPATGYNAYLSLSRVGATMYFRVSDVADSDTVWLTASPNGIATFQKNVALAAGADLTLSDGKITATNSANEQSAYLINTHATLAANLFQIHATRAGSSAYNFANWRSSAGADTEFLFSGDGNGTCDGTWLGGGADLTENYEWLPAWLAAWELANPTLDANKDLFGIAVAIVEGTPFIKPVADFDPITFDPKFFLGVTSNIGGLSMNSPLQAPKKYKRDGLGNYEYEVYSQIEWVEITEPEITEQKTIQVAVMDGEKQATMQQLVVVPETIGNDGVVVPECEEMQDVPLFETVLVTNPDGTPVMEVVKEAVTESRSYQHDQLPNGTTAPVDAITTSVDENGDPLLRRVISPDYDANLGEYLTRSERGEWIQVGRTGRLRVLKGQYMPDSAMYMGEIDTLVDEWTI